MVLMELASMHLISVACKLLYPFLHCRLVYPCCTLARISTLQQNNALLDAASSPGDVLPSQAPLHCCISGVLEYTRQPLL